MPSLRQFFSHRLIWLALLVALGIGALFARTIWTIRNDEWSYAVQTNANLARTLEQGLAWSLDSFDKSLEGVAREVSRPEVWALPPTCARGWCLTTRCARAARVMCWCWTRKAMSSWTRAQCPRRVNFADRDYFLAFRDRGEQGLFFGKPVPSRVTGLNILPISRGYYNADGSFAGVVVGAIRLSYFNELFGSLDLGPNSGINMFRQDGVVISASRTVIRMWAKRLPAPPTCCAFRRRARVLLWARRRSTAWSASTPSGLWATTR